MTPTDHIRTVTNATGRSTTCGQSAVIVMGAAPVTILSPGEAILSALFASPGNAGLGSAHA